MDQSGSDQAELRRNKAIRILGEAAVFPASEMAIFHRDYVLPHVTVSLDDLLVLQRIVQRLCDTLVEPTAEGWSRARAALAALEGQSLSAAPAPAAPAHAPPSGPAHEVSPWARGALPSALSAAQGALATPPLAAAPPLATPSLPATPPLATPPLPATPPLVAAPRGSLEPVAALGATTAAPEGAASTAAVPFQPGAPAAPPTPAASPRPARPAGGLEPITALGETAAVNENVPRLALPFSNDAPATPASAARPAVAVAAAPAPAAGPAPAGPRLPLELYASYCAARDASAEKGAALLAQHGVSAPAEEAAWAARFAADEPARRRFAELKAQYDAWWKTQGTGG